MDPLSDPRERRVFYAALDSFRQYRHASHYNVTHLRRQSFYSLPNAHIDILDELPFNLSRTFGLVDDAIDHNADIAEAILEAGLASFGIDPQIESWKGQAKPTDMDKARSTIRQLYRDWSAEGEPERRALHYPIISALASYLPATLPSQKQHHQILVPGAGLGRLVLELCSLGYVVQGNEISYHQMLASNYILNCTQRAGQHTLYPWALSFSNHLTRADQLRFVSIPDVNPADEVRLTSRAIPADFDQMERLTMNSGDFSVLYRGEDYQGQFHAVVTCFFIDTAPNVIKYIETIKHCLRSGGIWINIGPLQWHFESSPTPAEREKHNERGGTDSQDEGIGEPGSFELSHDEVIALLQRLGFEILEQSQVPAGATGYVQDSRSMLQHVYRPAFWVAMKAEGNRRSPNLKSV